MYTYMLCEFILFFLYIIKFRYARRIVASCPFPPINYLLIARTRNEREISLKWSVSTRMVAAARCVCVCCVLENIYTFIFEIDYVTFVLLCVGLYGGGPGRCALGALFMRKEKA